MIFTLPIRKSSLWSLKFIGVLLFVMIVSRIDRSAILTNLEQTNIPLMLAAFPFLILMYVWKTARWHTLVKTLGIHPTFIESWQIYNIGTFLGTITPAKVGEVGRAVYLRRAGLSDPRSLGAVILDRAADIIIIGLLAIGALGILFGDQWIAIGMIAILFYLVIARRFIPHAHFFSCKLMLSLFLWTILSWITYFAWAVLVARSIGILTPLPILIAVFTLAGIIAMFPIAPSGLGTRDAALITLLTPYNVGTEQAVALAFLMFISIVASSSIGGYYYLRR